MRRLIINADDFGFTSGVNRAILDSHTRGIVTSATLMANGGAFEEATRLARTVPHLSIGCHAVLIDGIPLTSPEKIPTLVASKGKAAGFRDNLKAFAAQALLGRIAPEEIEIEVLAQIQKIQAAGISVSHVDTHKHTHLFPSVLRPLLRAAKACGVGAIRNPFGPRFPLRSTRLLAKPGLWTRYAEVRILSAFASRFRAAVSREGMVTPDGTLGIEVTGVLDETLFRALAEAMPEGTWEFVCHPGYNDADLQNSSTRLRASRETELRVLTLPSARQLMQDHGISLISYRDLLPARNPVNSLPGQPAPK